MEKIKKFFKGSPYRIFLASFALFLIVLTVVLLILIRHYLTLFEEYLPQKTLDRFMEETPDSYWRDLLYHRYTERSNGFEKAERIISELGFDGVKTSELSVNRYVAGENSDEPGSPVYMLRYKGREFAILNFRTVETIAEFTEKYKIIKYEVGSVKLVINDSEASGVNITVTVPPDYTVDLNGRELTSKQLESSRVEYGTVSEFEQGIEGVPYLVRYRVDGLFCEPEIVIKNEKGEICEPDIDGYDYYYGLDNSYTKSVKAVIPDGYSLFVNGKKAGETYIKEKDLIPDFTNVPQFPGEKPSSVRYEIEGLFLDAKVEVKNGNGDPAPLDKEENGIKYFDFALAEDNKANLDLAGRFLNTYLNYVAQGRTNLQTNYSNTLSYTLYGSEADTLIRQSYNGIYWNNSYYMKNLKTVIFDYTEYNEDCFSCKASYSTVFQYYNIENPKQGTFRLLFVKSYGDYKLVRMVNID